eukprot:gene5847-6088_t
MEVETTVIGTIPRWLSGMLIMNGGGDFSQMRHLFDGYALLSKFRLADGRAWGSQRYLGTKAYQAYKAQGHVVYNEFGTPPGSLWSFMQQMLAPIIRLVSDRACPMTDNACVSLYAVGTGAAVAAQITRSRKERHINSSDMLDSAAKQTAAPDDALLLAITEDQFGNYLVNPETLETLQQVQFSDGVPAIMQSPHPAVLDSGMLINFSRTFPFGGMHVWRQDRSSLQREKIAYIPDRHPLTPAWMHDLIATERHVLLIEQPLYMNFLCMLAGVDLDAVWMRWRPEEGVRLHLVALDGSRAVQTFICPAFAFVHTGNAFESADGLTLHVDLIAYDDPAILNHLKLSALSAGPEDGRQVPACQYMRLDVPLVAPGGSNWIQGPRPLIPDAQGKHVDFVDFPTIHPAVKGRPYRFVYTTCAVRPTNIGNGLSKLDLHTGDVLIWHSAGGVMGEPQFIPKPDAVAEDDGVVLSSGVDEQGLAFLLVMDASSWTELARARLPYSTPYRFHGTWLPPLV